MTAVRPGRVLVAAIVASVLVGCAGGGAGAVDTTRPANSAISTSPATTSTGPTGRTTPPVTAGSTAPAQSSAEVTSTSAAAPSSSATAEATAEVAVGEPTRIEVPALGLDVEIGPVMDMVDGVIDPPTMVQAHRVRGITHPDTLPGPAAENTVYLAGHAWDQDEAAFTALNEVQVGAEVVLTTPTGRLTYRILSVDEVPKDDIAAFAPAWQVRPGGLVLLTCSPRDGVWPDNRVIIAEFVG